MNILSANEVGQYEVVGKINKSEEDDYQSNIELCMPERFYPKLSKAEIATLETPFCVDDMKNTRCFSSHKRPIRIIKKYRDLYGLKKDIQCMILLKFSKGKQCMLFVVL